MMRLNNMNRKQLDKAKRSRYAIVRGQRVTEEQAEKMVITEYNLKNVKEWTDINQVTSFIGRMLPDNKEWFNSGWLWQSGEVGGEINVPVRFQGRDKLKEFKKEWQSFAERYPFLDIRFGYYDPDDYIGTCGGCELCPLHMAYESMDNERRKAAKTEKGTSEDNGGERQGNTPEISLEDRMKKMQHMAEESFPHDVSRKYGYFRCNREKFDECLKLHEVEYNLTAEERNYSNFYEYRRKYQPYQYIYAPICEESVRITVCVNHGHVDIYFGEEAVKSIQEYSRKYTCEQSERYTYLYGFEQREPYLTKERLKKYLDDCGRGNDLDINIIEDRFSNNNYRRG